MERLSQLLAPESGVFPDLSFEEYKKLEALNASRLKRLKISPAHFRAGEEVEHTSTEAQSKGSLIHCAILEGHAEVDRQFAVLPPHDDIRTRSGEIARSPKLTSEWKLRYEHFKSTIGTRTPIPSEWLTISTLVHHNAKEHSILRPLLLSLTKQTELTLVWDTKAGFSCKGRVDLIDVDKRTILDLKTTSKPLTTVSKSIARYSYHLSAAFYLRLAKRLFDQEFGFVLAFAETSPPYAVVAAPLSKAAVDQGYKEVDQLMHKYRKCMDSGIWPGPKSPAEFNLPEWYEFGD